MSYYVLSDEIHTLTLLLQALGGIIFIVLCLYVVGFASQPLNYVQRVLALCHFWDLEKFALAKNRISKIFVLCTQ